MLFNSALYGVFLVLAFVVFWLIRQNRLARLLFLIAISYGFYFYGTYDNATDPARESPVPLGPIGWSVLCLGIIFVGSSLDFWIGRVLGRTENPRKRKALLLASIFYYLGVLSLFKYFNLAADSVAAALHAVGIAIQPMHLKLALPFGISFFTFETMSYTIDVYRRELPPADKYLDYLLFVCFFPHLVAGPIVRPRSMLPQLAKTPVADPDMQAQGLWLIATGLAKKVMIGDYLSISLVGRVFDNPERYSSLEVLVGVYAYAIKIYCDFSGYSDVAIGSSLLFGYRLPPNFDAPYTSHNLQDFWRRWHISLSSWLRDYLYIPLGGNRRGFALSLLFVIVTFALGGLWHGANWTFVVWGVLHGLAVVVVHLMERAGWSLPRGMAWLLTMIFTIFAWVFFRASNLEDAMAIASTMLGARGFITSSFVPEWAPVFSSASYTRDGLAAQAGVLYTAALMIVGFAIAWLGTNSQTLLARWRWSTGLGVVIATLGILALLNIGRVTEFLYFNF